MDKKTSKVKNIPPLKCCKACPYNIGSPVTGLCASCDDNHPAWNTEKWIQEKPENQPADRHTTIS